MSSAVVTAVAFVVIAGLIAALLLVIASHVFYVPVDDRVSNVREILPGANCGGCGYAGCDDYAAAVVGDENTPCNACTVGGASVAAQIAEMLGRNAGSAEEKVAQVKCNGTCDASKKILEWQGMQSCAGAKTFFSGNSAECTRGINEADYRSVEFFSLLCKSEGFSVSFRVRHGEIAFFIFIYISALYLCDYSNRTIVQTGNSADYCSVISIKTVAVHFIKVSKDKRNVVLYGRTVFMTNQLKAFISCSFILLTVGTSFLDPIPNTAPPFSIHLFATAAKYSGGQSFDGP